MKRLTWDVDGDSVFGRLHMPTTRNTGPAPLVVMGHGLSSSQAEFYDFPDKLAASGFAALALDYRGHGQSGGERGVLSKERVLADLQGAVAAVKKEPNIDHQRIALLGHSTGGALVLYAAPRIPNVQCLVALAPLARTRDEMNLFEFWGYTAARWANGPVGLVSKTGLKVPYKIDYSRLYADPAAVERGRKDGFLQTTIPVKNYRALVKELDGVELAAQTRLPTLVMVAEYDVVVGKYNSRRVYEALAGPKKFVEVPKSGHSMCGDHQSDFVAREVTAFLADHLRGASGT